MALNSLLVSLNNSAKNGVSNMCHQALIILKQTGWLRNLCRSSSIYWSDGEDPYNSFLELRNTAVDNLGSPAQLLMNRHLKSILSMTPQQLLPRIINPNKVTTKLQKNQNTRKQYYNISTKQPTSLQPNESVRVQKQNRWLPAKVIKQADTPNSYFIRCPDGTQIHQNRKHLMMDQTNKTTSTHPTSWDYDDIESAELE